MNDTVVHRIFSTPIIQLKFTEHEKYIFLDQEKKVRKPPGWTENLNTSFPNIPDDDPFIDPITNKALQQDILKSIVTSLKNLDLPIDIYFFNFWYNIYHDNQGQESHWHLPEPGNIMPYWSGIYYNKNSSPTFFYRDHSTYKTHFFKGYNNSKLSDCNLDCYYPNVNDGDILLFPPFLYHSTRSEDSHRYNMRLTFSFNIGLNNAC